MNYDAEYMHLAPKLTTGLSMLVRVAMGKSELQDIARKKFSYYRRIRRLDNPEPKRRKQKRTYDVQEPLKTVQKRIHRELHSLIQYPDYIAAGKKNSNYLDNCRTHLSPGVFISLDIESFFESLIAREIFSIWRGFLKEEHENARLLTQLTTLNGALPRGAPSSPILANLSFWDIEPGVVNKLKQRGFLYTRYVDDVAISSPDTKSDVEIREAIGIVLEMFHKKGVSRNVKKTVVKRRPQEMKLHNIRIDDDNLKIPKAKRKKIRAMVHRVCRQIQEEGITESYEEELTKIKGTIDWVNTLHPKFALTLNQQIEMAKRGGGRK